MAGSAFPSLACLLTGLLLLLQCQAGAAAVITTTATPIFPYQPKGQTIQDFQVLLRIEAPAVGPFTAGAVAVVLDVEEHRISYVTDAAKHVKKASGILGVYVRSSKDSVGWVEEAGLDGAAPRGRLVKDDSSPVEGGLVMAHDKMLSAGGSGGSIILVTDRADTTVKSFDDRDVPVHILDVGVGSSAIPTALYTAFIHKKRGTYSFVDAGADTVELASALAVLVAGLREVVSPTKKTVKFSVPVTRVRRGGVDVALSAEKDAFDIDVLYAGEVKNFIVHLDVPGTLTAGSKKCPEKLLVLEYTLDSAIKSSVYITRPLDNGYPLPMPLPMPVPTVLHHVVEFELLETVQKLMETYPSTKDLADQLLVEWTVLLNKYRFQVGWDLVGLQAEIDKIVSHLREHQEVSYILSWWSGYQAQRPTILGSWENHLAVFVHHTVIKSWTKQVVTLNVNIVIDATDHCKDARQCSAPVNELFSKDTTAAGTFILNPVYRNLSLDKLNFLLRDLFQAACEAERNLASATTTPVTQ